jgi:protein-disulfide isomerase
VAWSGRATSFDPPRPNPLAGDVPVGMALRLRRVNFRTVRHFLCFVLLGALGASSAAGDAGTRQRLVAYFEGWYSYVPGSRVSASETREVALSDLEPYRISRQGDSKAHQESSVALYDRARDEVFVGDVFHDPGRAAAGRPFEGARDLGNIQASLSDAFGLPVQVALGDGARGVLRPLRVSIEQQKGASATRPGFVSIDGATLLLGEFHSLAQSPAAFRRKLLSESAGVRTAGPSVFTVVEFVDFQCERCRKRTPEARRAARERGGAFEIRFLPLAKMHDWAFAAAESGAALAALEPELFERYADAVFARQEKMAAAASRELAADIAEAAGVKEKFAAELSTGRARDRVLADITLALRLGITGTPSFVEGGTFVSGEHPLLETYLAQKFPSPTRTASPGGRP